MRRLARSGFFQRAILPLLGFYPWECFACRKIRYLRVRGKRVLRRIWDDDLFVPADETELPVYSTEIPAEQREFEQDPSSSQWAE
ncbi:MAG TPA: hypothetical protein VMR02_15540 [Terracidiphilus sp.]|jgi:hypothetical protein|nr:hypothetical protein [Terracidiphilus sp.]